MRIPCLVALAMVPLVMAATAVATPAAADPRIQLIAYDADQIVTLNVAQGFAAVVELADDERVENVVLGNSAGWQVTANRRGDRVIVKPLGGAAPTNLIVLTGSRRYVFVLDPYGETAFVTRFSYPAPPAPDVTTAAPMTPTYSFRGDKALFPQTMSDDGQQTRIRWAEQRPMPAIFALNGSREQLINGRMIAGDYVVEGAAARYIFRYGKAEATATRQVARRRR